MDRRTFGSLAASNGHGVSQTSPRGAERRQVEKEEEVISGPPTGREKFVNISKRSRIDASAKLLVFRLN